MRLLEEIKYILMNVIQVMLKGWFRAHIWVGLVIYNCVFIMQYVIWSQHFVTLILLCSLVKCYFNEFLSIWTKFYCKGIMSKCLKTFFAPSSCVINKINKQPKYWQPVYQMDKIKIYQKMFLWNYLWNNWIWVLQIYIHKRDFCIFRCGQKHTLSLTWFDFK